jgi:uncharacterized protein with PQ loop repeat
MDTSEIVGFCALCLGSIPQFHKIETERNVTSFSKEAIILRMFVSCLWVYYGFVKKSPIILFGSVCSIVFEMYLIYKILKSEKDK